MQINMTQDFYLKAQALHEEFQKKELHYLYTERKLNNSIMWKKDLNLPLQEYLQRINQREKETEQTYKKILKQLEELDQHTDALSLNLEKLGVLQASLTTSIAPNWLQRLDLNMESNYPTFDTHSLCTTDVIPLSRKSVSAQTENNLCCEKCKSPVLTDNQPSYLLENLSSSNIHLGMNGKPETKKASKLQINSINLLNEAENTSQYIESKNGEHILMTNHKDFSEENLKIKGVDEKNSKQGLSYNVEFAESRNSSFGSEMHVGNGSINSGVVKEKNDCIKAADSELHKETFVSKSDVDSMNNEFDFLESNTANMPLTAKIKIEQGLTNQANTRESRLNSKKQHLNSQLISVNDESETSASLSGFNSPHLSVASDSDGVYEKESPLTASAAYQALLGNAVHPVKTPQNVSGSESDDDVENAFASAVQRHHLESKSSLKQMKDETSDQQASTKPLDKPSKLTSVNRPQSKLSKNTRKVLGLDSSSGSEVEIAVNSPRGKKVDEDSDEFGFYD